jgi:type VI secretion system protein ImpL
MIELLRELAKLAPARWAATLGGALALGLMVWYLGPIIAIAGYRPFESTGARLIAVAAILVVWAGVNLARHLSQARSEKKMIAGLAGTERPGDADIAALRERLGEALRHLRRVGGADRRGKQYLYDLPWYLLIGPSGAGKTTALTNSGLKFPLSDRFGKKPVRGVAGTRNCDWFLTDEAVLIDTAGRYTTQDSDEKADQAAWLGFLDLLKEYRPRQPINGAIVALSLEELARLPETERLAHARVIRQRLAELLERFRVRFPVYVLFTKSDLIAGFVETYETLTREEREQVWGMTFLLDRDEEAEPVVTLFGAELRLLFDRLNERMIERVQQEADIHRRGLIFGLPMQLVSLGDAIREFLEEIFLASRYEARPLLRGVYFTSATQESTPIDRLMGAIAQRFGLQRQRLVAFSGAGRSYFLTRLLRAVVFAEASIVSTDPRVERRQRLARWAAYAGGAIIFAMACGAWTVSYVENRRAERQLAAAVDAARTETAALDTPVLHDDDPAHVLPALDRLRGLPGGYNATSLVAPTSMDFGLYQGAKLHSQEIAAYRRALNIIFLPRLLSRLQQQLVANMTRADVLYEGLKVYLMLGGQHSADPALVKQWMKSDWESAYHGVSQETTRDALLHHLDALLEGPLEEYPLDRSVVEEARRVLRAFPVASRAYETVKDRATADSEFPDWRISDHAGPAADRALARSSRKSLSEGIPGLFTREGFHHAFLPHLADAIKAVQGEGWVLGETTGADRAAAADALERDVLALYYDDYIQRWEQILGDLSVQPLHNMAQAAEVLNFLSGTASPLKLVWQAIDRETQLTKPPEAAGETTASKTPKPSAGSLIPAASAHPLLYGQPVEDRFQRFHEFVAAEGGGPAPMAQLLRDISDLYLQINRMIVTAPPGSPGEANAVADATAAARKVESEASPLPPSAAALPNSVARNTAALISGGARNQIALQWAQLLPLCTQALEGRYPARRDSAVDIAPEDFAKLFAPSGVIASFFNTELSQLVDISHTPWKARDVDAGGINLPSDALLQFQRAARIRDAYFSTGGTPMAKFEINPLSLDPESARVVLNVEGQEISFDGGAPRPLVAQWPGPSGVRQSSVTFEPKTETKPTDVKPVDAKQPGVKPSEVKEPHPQPADTVTIARTGAWSVFRLLDAGHLETLGGPDRWRVTFAAGGHRAVFELHAGSIVNPLASHDLAEFRCPSL